MSLKDSIRQHSLALVKRETVTLPECGDTVTVRGLMTAELTRVNAAGSELRTVAIICLCVEDPGNPGTPLFNFNDLNDRDTAGGLHMNDSVAILNAHNRLAGLEESNEELLKNSERTGSSSTSSPSDTASSPTS